MVVKDESPVADIFGYQMQFRWVVRAGSCAFVCVFCVSDSISGSCIVCEQVLFLAIFIVFQFAELDRMVQSFFFSLNIVVFALGLFFIGLIFTPHK